MNDKKRVTVVIKDDIYKKLLQLAENDSRTITSMVTFILLKYINENVQDD